MKTKLMSLAVILMLACRFFVPLSIVSLNWRVFSADLYWWGNYSGNEGEWATAANWYDASTNSASAAIPADGDTIYFDNRAYYNSTSGTYQSVTDAGSTGEPDLDGIYVSSDYDGDIGSAGGLGVDPDCATVHMTAGDFYFAGTGSAWFECSDSGTSNDTIDRTIVDGTGQLYITSKHNDGSNIDTWDEVFVYSGYLYIIDKEASDTTCWVNDLYVMGGQVVADPCAYRTVATADQVTIYQSGGTIYWTDDFDAWYLTAGTGYWGVSTEENGTGIQGDYLELRNDDTANPAAFYWQVYDKDGESILKQFRLFGDGCTLDASASTHSDTAKQIGTGSSEISENFGGTVKLNPQTHNVTFGSGSKITNYGGSIYPPLDKDVTW